METLNTEWEVSSANLMKHIKDKSIGNEQYIIEQPRFVNDNGDCPTYIIPQAQDDHNLLCYDQTNGYSISCFDDCNPFGRPHASDHTVDAGPRRLG